MPEETMDEFQDDAIELTHNDLPFGHSPIKSPNYAASFSGGFDAVTYDLFKMQVEDDFDGNPAQACEYVNDVLATPTDEHNNTLLHAAAIRGDETALSTIIHAIEHADPDLAKQFLEKRNSAGHTALQAALTPTPMPAPPSF